VEGTNQSSTGERRRRSSIDDEQGKVICRKKRIPLLNADGSPRITVKGKQDETFLWEHPDGKGGWAMGLGVVAIATRILYN
jgi:hypothetical protein